MNTIKKVLKCKTLEKYLENPKKVLKNITLKDIVQKIFTTFAQLSMFIKENVVTEEMWDR